MNYNIVKSVGNYAVVKIEKTQTTSGIVSSHGNVGMCIACSMDSDLNNKKVMFNGRKTYEKYGDFMFVPYADIFCVVN
jgi:predicted amino acid dehydrogenase|tara:strand:+ start:211 stop:444 length:234 start_codon:yes stop_codon:yes gene_type:complete